MIPKPAERKSRPRVEWSDDSQAFYVTRSDSRNVKELWVINSLSDPRPNIAILFLPHALAKKAFVFLIFIIFLDPIKS